MFGTLDVRVACDESTQTPHEKSFWGPKKGTTQVPARKAFHGNCMSEPAVHSHKSTSLDPDAGIICLQQTRNGNTTSTGNNLTAVDVATLKGKANPAAQLLCFPSHPLLTKCLPEPEGLNRH